ncbi:hypothetical protein [Bordetella holmesii]|uniref:N-acetyltransferase YedL n=2 Tax=Bordetella holmesii TaxID=35814 RepID=A0ABN0RX02_9BORD|nr:hypothetical protein [Bordetella holmesii]AHV91790.1 hypothetical protein D560_3060 [Bordetella holmesii ATCC 51541]AIT27685.1 hypothetical protein D558_3038 [Bordetella holmesii 44057]EWM40460.1 hypothetical protein D555_3098 [Bordetella holmesii 35009]EWM42259.1 hypothetical protein D556_3036 [Bordetella holmesii 41130]EWM49263.1 hypothetical protein D557_2340 [Bordetella holmesii 70147]
MSTLSPQPAETLRQAADRLAQARRAHEHGERGIALLMQSRENFINSLRHTGLDYAQARIKFDICLEQQYELHKRIERELEYAQRVYETCVNGERVASNA